MRLSSAAWMICIATTAFAQQAPTDSPSYWINQAQAVAPKINDPAERAGVLTAIAGDWLAISDYPEALASVASAEALLNTLTDPNERFAGYFAAAGLRDQIAQRQGVSDPLVAADTQAAAAFVSQIPAGPAHDAAAQQTTRFQRISGGYAVAAPQINAIVDPVARTTAWADVAVGYALAGPAHKIDYQNAIKDAQAAAEKVSDIGPWAESRLQIIQARVRAGDFDGANAQAKSMDDRTAAQAQVIITTAYAQANMADQAQLGIQKLIAAAPNVPESLRTQIWLNIARIRLVLNDKVGAKAAIDTCLIFAAKLESADRADNLMEAAQTTIDLGDTARAAQLANDAAAAIRDLLKPEDQMDLLMTLAGLQARLGQGAAARQSVADAISAAAKLPADKRHPEGDPAPSDQIEVIKAAAAMNDFATAQALAAGVTDMSAHHDAILAIADAQIRAGQYQGAEDAAVREGPDTEASVCGMIAGSLARTRDAGQADRWVVRLTNPSDIAAANLAVAQVVIAKGKAQPPAAGR